MILVVCVHRAAVSDGCFLMSDLLPAVPDRCSSEPELFLLGLLDGVWAERLA